MKLCLWFAKDECRSGVSLLNALLTILQCLNHYLGVHHQVLSMHLLDVLASLGLHLVNECVEQVDGCSVLAAIERRLGRVEFGKQTVGNTLIVDEARVYREMDTCLQRRNGWRMDAAIPRRG